MIKKHDKEVNKIRIKELRIKNKLTQQQLAELLKIDRSAIARWESGENLPTADKLPELAKIFKCKIDDLFDK